MNQKPLIRRFGGQYNAADFQSVFVIGFAGLYGSGKSTIASALSEELKNEHSTVLQIAFADRLKEVTTALVGSVPWEKEDTLYGGSTWDMRQFLMQFGTEFVRDNLSEHFWVDVVAQQVLEQKPSVVVIDDMRFPSEYAFVKTLGIGILVKRDYRGTNRTIKHRSEMPEKMKIPNSITNNGSVADAVRKVKNIIAKHPRYPI